jgi:hypothetical protein
MFRFLAARKASLSAADETAGQMILSLGGPAAMASVRKSLRWLDPEDADRGRQLTFLLRALETRLDYHPPAEVRFLDKII